jgi:hypothetical protein
VFVVPRAKTDPEAGVEFTVMFVLQLSVARIDQVTTALVPHVPTVKFVGQTMVGGVVSTTETRCVQVTLELPQQSVALQMREAM